tara:strand:+ start:1516 stop:1677 length:162 start_codon:yes stop_codon:yes gene_type:complete
MNAVVHNIRLELSGAMEKRKGELWEKEKNPYPLSDNHKQRLNDHCPWERRNRQ